MEIEISIDDRLIKPFRRLFTRKRLAIAAVLGVAGYSLVVHAVTYTFSSGATISASQMNQNFTDIQSVVLPTGAIIDYTGASCPSGFLLCPTTQTNISRTTYSALFAAIGTTWGAGDGSTTFGMPWFAPDYIASQANGNVGTSTIGVVMAHTHTVAVAFNGANLPAGASYGAAAASNTTTNSQSPAGGSANLGAGARVLKCVKL